MIKLILLMGLIVKTCYRGRNMRTPRESFESLKARKQSADVVSGSSLWTFEQTFRMWPQTFKQPKCWVCAQKGGKNVTQIQDSLTSGDVRWIIMRHKRRRRPTLNYAVEQRPNTLRPRYSTLMECWCLAAEAADQ